MAKKIKLTKEDDLFKGSGKDEIIIAKAGDDSVSGGGGNDTIKGGAGNDVLKGGAGDDTLNGGADNDILFGGAGDDRLIGGKGTNTLDGGEGDDTAVLTGNFADAKVTAATGGGYVIEGLDGSITTVKNVELFTFADGTVTTTQLDEKVTGSSGQTFTLTSAIDNVAGTSGDDVITAGTTGAGDDTLNAGDIIKGGDGSDTINIFGNGNAGAFATATISGVEIVNAQLLTGGALNVSGNADVTKATVTAGSSGNSTVTLTKAQTAGISGSVVGDAVALNETLTFTFSDASAGTADSASLTLTTATADIVDIDAIETLTVASDGTANSIGNLSADSLGSLTITGAGTFSAVVVGGSAIKTVDASANTAGITLDISASAAADMSVKGTAANDTLTVDAALQTSADVIDLGDGTDDTLLFDAAMTLNTATLAAVLSKVTNVEEIGTVGAVLTVDDDLVSQSQFSTSGAGGGLAVSNASQGAILEFGAGVAVASTADMKLGANTLNIELLGSKTAAADVTAGLTITGSSTLNIASSGTAGVANNVLTLTVADNQAINLTGSQNTTLDVTNAGALTGVNIDASAFTGKATITATDSADIVKGGTGDDTITGAVGADNLTGGAGSDTFVYASGDTGQTVATADTITDFVSGTDVFDIGGAPTTYAEADGSGAADFTALVALADAALTAAGDVYVAYNALGTGNAYVFIDQGGVAGTFDAGDTLVVLTGVNLAAEIAATDFI